MVRVHARRAWPVCLMITSCCVRPGGELFNKLLQVGVFSERTVANMMKQILTALQHCHKANIVHRDVRA